MAPVKRAKTYKKAKPKPNHPTLITTVHLNHF